LAGLLLFLFFSLTVPSSPAESQSNPPAGSAVDWTTMNSNANHTNYVAQNQIGASSAQNLQLGWTFPFPAAPKVSGLNVTGQGSISPPLVVNGTVYVVTNYLTVYAINAETGGELWSYQATLNTTGLPLGPLTGHMHGINYYRGDIWVSTPDCSALALDALTGALVMKISDICKNIPGNAGFYKSSGVPPVFDGNTMIWSGSDVSEGTDVGRGFVAAYDLTTGSLLWRWYVAPPAGGNSSWDLNSCRPPSCHGNVTPVTGDWGTMSLNGPGAPGPLAGAGPSFGDPVVDTRHGIVYVSTSQASPDWNGTYRPGPNLYSDSVVALNATNGEMIWFYQATPHDLYDFDCGWNTVLGNVTQGGSTQEAVFKACKNGYLYALNALTGTLLWYFSPPSVTRNLTGNANYVVTGNYSGTLPWINYPSTQAFEQCPGENGAVESDIAYAYSMIYVATMNFCTSGQVAPVSVEGGQVWGVKNLSPHYLQANTTIYAVHASSGKVAWSYSMSTIPYRGWLTASGGLIFAGALDGTIHILDAATGTQVYDLNVGPPLYESPTIGSGIDGQVYLYQLTSASSYGAFAGGTPGDLMAFTIQSTTSPSWVTYLPAVAIGLLAAVVIVLLVENRSLRRAASRSRLPPA